MAVGFLSFTRLSFALISIAAVDSPPVPLRTTALSRLELQCPAEEGEVVILEWSRVGFKGHVLLYRDDRVWNKEQNTFFLDRVELRDPSLRSGDLGVILKNVTSNYSGEYVCEAKIKLPDGKEKVASHGITLTLAEAAEPIVKESGEDVKLPCSSPGGARVNDLKWIQQDQAGRENVLLHFRNGRVENEGQSSTFSNRVELMDPALKSGDLTALLKKLVTEDSGTYFCVASHGKPPKHEVVVRHVPLTVKTGRSVENTNTTKEDLKKTNWWIARPVLAVFGLVALVVLVFVCYRKCNKKCKCQAEDAQAYTAKEEESAAGSDSDEESPFETKKQLEGPLVSSSSLTIQPIQPIQQIQKRLPRLYTM